MRKCLLRNGKFTSAHHYSSCHPPHFAGRRHLTSLQCHSHNNSLESQNHSGTQLFRDSLSVTWWSAHDTTPQNMKALCEIGLDKSRHLPHAKFLHRELRIRMAHAVSGLLSLPPALAASTGILEVIDRHVDSIIALESFAFSAQLVNDETFTELLEEICETHEQTVRLVTEEVHCFAGALYGCESRQSVDDALRRFLTMRIGTRFLMKHYIKSRRGSTPGYSGLLQLVGDPAEIARSSAENSARLCKARLGQAPAILVKEDRSEDMTSPCVPAVLSYILAELFKNACRAVVERHAEGYDDCLPPIVCHIAQTKAGLSVKIHDEGTGISAEQLEKIGQFGHSTSNDSPWKALGCRSNEPQTGVLAGFGVGLTLSRLYARYFGGELMLSSEVGVGTHVYLRLAWSGESL